MAVMVKLMCSRDGLEFRAMWQLGNDPLNPKVAGDVRCPHCGTAWRTESVVDAVTGDVTGAVITGPR